jgi:hypothetical protein
MLKIKGEGKMFVMIMEPNKDELVIKQFFVGLGCGFLGLLVYAGLEPFIFRQFLDLFGSIMNALMVGYLSMILGLEIVGYFFLKKIGQQNEFLKSMLKSLVGFSLAMGLLYGLLIIFPLKLVPGFLMNLVLIFVPLISAIWGFNFRFRKKRPRFNKDGV